MKLIQPLRAVARILARPFERQLVSLVYPVGTQAADFLAPPGEPALLAIDSVSWRVFSNPVAMFVGGVTAVLLELAEPRVRTGVWEHTSFRERPLERLQRTGYAAMMTAFGARSRTKALIAHVNDRHARINGMTPAGTPYRASDAELLTWVHATATFGFVQAYARCVRPLPATSRDRYYVENQEAARLYGVAAPPATEAELQRLFERMRPTLERSDIVFEFLDILERVPLLPRVARPLQRLLLRAAVQCLPAWTRVSLGLDGPRWTVLGWQWAALRMIGRVVDHLSHPDLPASLARRRLGTPG